MEKQPYFYDEDLYKVSCYSYHEFIKTLALLQTKNTIDVNKTLFSPQYVIQHEDNSFKQYHAWYNLFSVLEEEYGVSVDLTKSHVNLSSYYLYLKDPLKLETPVKILVKTPVEEDLLEDEVSTEETSEEVLEAAVPEVDYDYLNSFYNEDDKSGSKSSLKDYCSENYGVELTKTKSFPNMIKELKEALS